MILVPVLPGAFGSVMTRGRTPGTCTQANSRFSDSEDRAFLAFFVWLKIPGPAFSFLVRRAPRFRLLFRMSGKGLDKVGVEEDLLVCRALSVAVHEDNPLLGEGGQDLAVQCPVLVLDKGLCGLENRLELLSRGHAGDVGLLVVRLHHVLEGGHTDHEELIQVGGRDGEEVQALHQRILL